MDRESRLELVRCLTYQVLETTQSPQLPTFSEDFAAYALTAGVHYVSEKIENFSPRDTGLDTMLVAGIFFQVIVEAEKLPGVQSQRISFVRREAKNFLATRLGGQITLSQFYRLLNLIEAKVQDYFEYIDSEWLGRGVTSHGEPSLPYLDRRSNEREELRQSLGRVDLPKNGRRITPEGLYTFLCRSEGRWFRLLDLEAHFKVEKKTAWVYLNHLLRAGIIEHNGEKTNRVRYALVCSCHNSAPKASAKM